MTKLFIFGPGSACLTGYQHGTRRSRQQQQLAPFRQKTFIKRIGCHGKGSIAGEWNRGNKNRCKVLESQEEGLCIRKI